MPYLTQDRELITITDARGKLVGDWSTIGDRTIEGSDVKFRPAAGAAEVIIPGRDTLTEITVGRQWLSERDAPLFADIMRNRKLYSDMTVTTVEQDLANVPIPATQQTYTGCAIKTATKSGADADGTEPVLLTLTISLGKVG